MSRSKSAESIAVGVIPLLDSCLIIASKTWSGTDRLLKNDMEFLLLFFGEGELSEYEHPTSRAFMSKYMWERIYQICQI